MIALLGLSLLASAAVEVEFARRDDVGAADRAAEPAVFHIAVGGNDANDGTTNAPLATLRRAVELTRLVDRDCERRIVFHDGHYSCTGRVDLTADDWDLVITAEHPGGAVLSGGVSVTGWRADPEIDGVWVADMPMEEVTDGLQYALVCNGEARTVATHPASGTMRYESNGSYRELVYDAEDAAGVRFDKIDLSSAWVSVKQQWVTTVAKIATNDVARHTFWLAKNLSMAAGEYNSGFQLCNTVDGLTAEGSWAYSCAERKIRYRPVAGETTDGVRTVLTLVPCLIYAKNTPGLVISNLVFEGCSRDGKFTGAYTMPHSAPLSFYYTRDTVIDNVEVRNCAYVGIGMTKPTRMTVRNCRLHSLGASAVRFYDGGNGGATVENNEIHDYGLTYGSSDGVYTEASGARIVGNLICYGAGSAVTMWGDGMYLASNEFHHVMRKSSDGGALYGAYNDSLVCDNYVHDLKGYPVLGLYCDEGGQRNLFTRNRTENVPWPIHMHSTQYNTVSNNTFRHGGQMTFSFQGSGHGVFCDNKVYQPNDKWTTTYYGNCDFWGRNEMFVLQADGSYVSRGLVDATRPRPSAGEMPAKDITTLVDADGNWLVPIDGKGNVALNFGRNWSEANKWSLQVGEDGYYRKGVPYGVFYAANDETYVYFGVRLFYNALKGYTGCKNMKNGGWRHCDALRIVLGEERRSIILYPNGFGCEADAAFGVTANDYGYCTVSGAPVYVIRVRRERIPFAGGKVPFNAMMWNEDLRELKMLYPATDENDPSGVLSVGN